MEYLPTNGLKDFVQHSLRLAFGEDSKHVAEGTIDRPVAAAERLIPTRDDVYGDRSSKTEFV